MTYTQAIEKVHSALKFGIRPGLDRISYLLNRLGDPHKKLKFVHIAGTNGKGSVSAMLSCMLIKSGRKTGLFTSPYVIDFLERIQIDGQMISKQDFAFCAEQVFAVADKMQDKPTEFELITAIALYCFWLKNCDVVVLEVGLGGKYDSTNVIENPLVSVITKVSMDHMNILGDTLEEIALQKCGIMKPGGTTVLSPSQEQAVINVVRGEAERLDNKLIECRQNSKFYNGKRFIYEDKMYELKMLGAHQVDNAIAAIEAGKVLGLEHKCIYSGIKQAFLPARMEVLSTSPIVILDGAHNMDGVKMLARNVRRFLKGKKIICVMAMMEDKQWQEAAVEINMFADKIISTKCSNDRCVDPAKITRLVGSDLDYNPFSAVRKALDMADEDSAVLVCGSLYLASDVRDFILRECG